MRADEFRQLLREQPFCAFRVQLTTGTFHDVHHPELAIVANSVVWICTPGRELGPIKFAERWVVVTLAHIVEIEFLDRSPQVTR
jgi:hypothetical protein